MISLVSDRNHYGRSLLFSNQLVDTRLGTSAKSIIASMTKASCVGLLFRGSHHEMYQRMCLGPLKLDPWSPHHENQQNHAGDTKTAKLN
jgi:hypothetical protein